MHTLHVHSDRNHFSLIRTTVHNLKLDKRLGLSFGGCAGSEGFLADQSDLHALDLYLDEVEVDPSHDDVSQMVKGFVVLEINVQAILNTDLHLHRHNLCLSFHTFIGQQHREVLLFGGGELVIL